MKQKLVRITPYINWWGSQYIAAHNLAYFEYGDASNKNIIICAHGLTRNSYDFDKIATDLSSDFRVIALDYPGRGASDRFKTKTHYNYQVYIKDTLIFLKSLDIRNCIWLGTSMGGIIGMALASKYPTLIKAMILNDIGPFISAKPLVRIGEYARQSLEFTDLASAKQHLKLIYSQFGISSEEDWDQFTKYSFVINQKGDYVMNYDPAIVHNMRTSSNKLKDVDMWHIWNKIICKLLVIHGAKSDILQQTTIEKMKKMKDLDLYVVDYAGHAPSLMTKDQIDYVKSWTINL
jgi:pimeloyl-ACP methyl ester carboxylesterase